MQSQILDEYGKTRNSPPRGGAAGCDFIRTGDL
jgi:hypothetical protein